MNKYIAATFFITVAFRPALAADLGIGGNGGGVGIDAGLGTDSQGVSGGAGVSVGGIGSVDAGASAGNGSAGAGVTGNAGGVGIGGGASAGSQGAAAGAGVSVGGIGGVAAGASAGNGSLGAGVDGNAGGVGVRGGVSAGSQGTSAGAGASVGGIGAGASVGNGGSAAPSGAASAGASGSSAGSTAAASGNTAGVASGARGTATRAKEAGGSIASTVKRPTLSRRAFLPCSLQPSGCGQDKAQRTVGYSRQFPALLKAVRGTPPAVVRACQNAILSAARPLGAVRVKAASAGTLSRQRRGTLTAPIAVRIDYASQGGIEVRQAKVTCRLDAAGKVIAVT